MKTGKINSQQLIVMLVLSRLFILSNKLSGKKEMISGSSGMLIIVLGWGLSFLALLPLWILLQKNPGESLVSLCVKSAPKGYPAIVGLFYVFCLLVCGVGIAQFEGFLSTSIYPRASWVWIILICVGAVLYIAYLGIESLARVSFLVAVMAFVVYLMVLIACTGLIDGVNLISPFYHGIQPIVRASLAYVTQNMEMVAFFLLLPDLADGKPSQSFAHYATDSALILIIFTFAVTTVLGQYAQTRSFPVYTLSSISGGGTFYRFDFFHIVIWVCIALVRATLYLILATKLLNILCNGKYPRLTVFLNAAIVTVLALVSSQRAAVFQGIDQFLKSGFPVLILLVFLPLVLLVLRFVRKEPAQ